MTDTAVTMTTILSAAGEIVTEGAGWMTDVVGIITGNDLLMFFVLFGVIGTGIGLVGRILHLR